MLGESELSNMLNRGFILRKPFIQYYLNPMNSEESWDYIRYKIEAAGVRADDVISSGALNEIFELSHGLPGLIDEICIRVFTAGAEEEVVIIDKEAIEKYRKKELEVSSPVMEFPIDTAEQKKEEEEEDVDITENEADRALYDEIITFANNVLFKKEGKFYLTDMDEVQKNVGKVISNMLSQDSLLITMTKNETPDNYLVAHTVNVCILAIKLGIGMGYDTEQLNKLGVAAFLHDVGLAEHYSVIDKAEKLSIKEVMEIMKHPEHGTNVITGLEKLYIGGDFRIINAIQQHHERVDGSGYPDNLEGDKIDEFARLIGIVDVYEALTHSRKHKDAIISTEAMGTIVMTGDIKFGPDIVRALIEELSFYPIGTYVVLKTGEIGRVIRVNKHAPVKPVVKLLYNSKGEKIKGKEIDLSKDSEFSIKNAIDEKKLKFMKKIDNAWSVPYHLD